MRKQTTPICLSKITHRGELRIAMQFEHSTERIQQIKSIIGRKWSQTKRCWHLPYCKSSFEHLEQVFGKVNLVFPKKEKVETTVVPAADENKTGEKNNSSFQVRVEWEHDYRVKVFVPWQKKEWVEQIKSLSDRAWNKKEKYWSVPKNMETKVALEKMFGAELSISEAIKWTNQPNGNKLFKEAFDKENVYNKEIISPPKNKLKEYQQRAITAFEEKLILENKAWRTRKTYKSLFTHFVKHFSGTKPSTISKVEIEKYI